MRGRYFLNFRSASRLRVAAGKDPHYCRVVTMCWVTFSDSRGAIVHEKDAYLGAFAKTFDLIGAERFTGDFEPLNALNDYIHLTDSPNGADYFGKRIQSENLRPRVRSIVLIRILQAF